MRIAVTGAAGDFGTAILRALTDDERASELIGIGRAPLRLEHPKLRAESCDVRSERLGELVAGCETVIHLAFILIPGHDTDEAHSINQDGTENVLARSAAAGVGRLVVASSLSAHGARPLGPNPRAYAAERGFELADSEALGEVVCASLVGFSLQQTIFGARFAGLGNERFIAAWVDSTIAVIESLERSHVHV